MHSSFLLFQDKISRGYAMEFTEQRRRFSKDEYIPPEKALELIQTIERKSYAAAYCPTGNTIFINPAYPTVEIFFAGSQINTPVDLLNPNETWSCALGGISISTEAAASLMSYLYQFISDQLAHGRTFHLFRGNNKQNSLVKCRFVYNREKGQVFAHYLDRKNKQATVFIIHKQHALEMYFGIQSAIKDIVKASRGYQVKKLQANTSLPALLLYKEIHCGDHYVDILLGGSHVILRNVMATNETVKLYGAHAKLIIHHLNGWLYSRINSPYQLGNSIVLHPCTKRSIDNENDNNNVSNSAETPLSTIGFLRFSNEPKNALFFVSLQIALRCVLIEKPASLIDANEVEMYFHKD